MDFEDAVVVVLVIAYLVVWVAAFVSYFRTPSVAWASDLERHLTLAGLVFLGWLGVGVWFFAVRPTLNDRLAEMQPEGPPIEAWRLKHLS